MGVHCSCTCFILAFLFLILPTPFSSPLFQKNISGTWETTKLSKLKVIYVSKSLCTFSSQSTLNSHKFDFIMVDFFGGRIWYCYVDFVVVRLLDPWGHVSTKYPPVCQFLCLCISGVFLQNTNENLKMILLLAVLANKFIECDISSFLKNWLVKSFCFAGSHRNIKFYNGLKNGTHIFYDFFCMKLQ